MINTNRDETCCFIGHRKIRIINKLINIIYESIESMIKNDGINTFLFGSNSEFNDICFEIVSKLKSNFKYIKRIYVRAEFPYIDDDYREYLLQKYDETIFPDKLLNSGRAVYVERNKYMIDNSYICLCYYDENYKPPRRKRNRRDLFDYQPKSGTSIAHSYAEKKCDKVINVFNK